MDFWKNYDLKVMEMSFDKVKLEIKVKKELFSLKLNVYLQ